MLKKKIFIATGGTGGHIYPALALVDDLKNNNYEISIITDSRGAKLINQENKEYLLSNKLIIINITNKKNLRNFVYLLYNVFFLIYKLRKDRCNLVIGFGSYVSIISIIASFFAFIPSIVHEQNKILSFTNNVSLFFSKICCTTFDETIIKWNFLKKKIIHTGMPIRNKIEKYSYNYKDTSINYETYFDIEKNINLLILGGSLGSSFITNIMIDSIKMLNYSIKSKLTIYHQARKEDIDKIKNEYDKMEVKYYVNDFFDNIGEIMSSSHLCISRSGASTLCELITMGLPSILIPIPNSKNNHQFYNALDLANRGMAYILDEKNTKKEKITSMINDLFVDSYFNDSTLLTISKLLKKDQEIHINSKAKIRLIVDTILGNSLQNKKEVVNGMKMKTLSSTC